MKRLTKDGRTILTGVHYTQFREKVWNLQGFQCKDCRKLLRFHEMDLHHIDGRGMGGSKRDDVLGKVEGLCRPCHQNPRGSDPRKQPHLER